MKIHINKIIYRNLPRNNNLYSIIPNPSVQQTHSSSLFLQQCIINEYNRATCVNARQKPTQQFMYEYE